MCAGNSIGFCLKKKSILTCQLQMSLCASLAYILHSELFEHVMLRFFSGDAVAKQMFARMRSTTQCTAAKAIWPGFVKTKQLLCRFTGVAFLVEIAPVCLVQRLCAQRNSANAVFQKRVHLLKCSTIQISMAERT